MKVKRKLSEIMILPNKRKANPQVQRNIKTNVLNCVYTLSDECYITIPGVSPFLQCSTECLVKNCREVGMASSVAGKHCVCNVYCVNVIIILLSNFYIFLCRSKSISLWHH